MSDIKIFRRFNDIVKLRFSEKVTKKFEKQLEKDAIEWFETTFKASCYKHNTKENHWYYSGGVLIFNLKGYGGFCYHHIIMAYHFHHWDSVYFQEGKEFGLRLKNNAKLPTDGQYISSTPYPKEDFSKVLPFQYGAHLSYYGYSFLDIK